MIGCTSMWQRIAVLGAAWARGKCGAEHCMAYVGDCRGCNPRVCIAVCGLYTSCNHETLRNLEVAGRAYSQLVCEECGLGTVG